MELVAVKKRESLSDAAIVSQSLVKFDSLPPCVNLPGESVNYDAQSKLETMLNPKYPAMCTEMIDSDEWIKKYGLKTNKLTFEDILSMIGFRQSKEYMAQLKRNIISKYSLGLFLQTHGKDGTTYNITVNENRLIDFSNRLDQLINSYGLRLQWLTSSSRRLFGVVIEQGVCFVLDCKQNDPIKFTQFRNCILKLLREQIARISSFNLIRCSDTIETFRDKAVVVSSQSIEEAIEWLNEWNVSSVRSLKNTITCEATMIAFQDKLIEGVYLISEGNSSDGSREILFDKLVKESHDRHIRLNTVSFDCIDMATVEFLKRLATSSYGVGRFHAYCLLKQYDDFVAGPVDRDPTKSTVFVHKREFGGAPPGAGIKNDVMAIFEEAQLAKETMHNLRALIDSLSSAIKNGKASSDAARDAAAAEAARKPVNRDEEYMTSKEWLLKHGLKARKLDIFEILNQVCFRHCEGVMNLQQEPSTGRVFYVGDGVRYYQGDAIPRSKVINARYCDKFAHVLWNDGSILHVHVTADWHRAYEKKVKIELEKYERRIDWLSKGSRELFGTVIENNICILIDTSQSMQVSLDFVKRKLATLMQEQLQSKQRFNLLSFNSKIYPWRDRMVEVDEFNMASALDWINSLNAHGSTNTLGAMRFALADMKTEAIYLLTDGRPDQDARLILSQVHLNTRIPIHTISFNCNDAEANKFLAQLAKETNGRYHYFNENGWDADPRGPVPYESEDTNLLKQEIGKGLKFLAQVASLRDESSRLSIEKQIELHTGSTTDRKSDDSSKSLKESPKSAVSNLRSDNNKPLFSSKYDSKNSFSHFKYNDTTLLSKRASLASLIDIQSFEWMLPETKQLLERQLKYRMSKTKRREEEQPIVVKSVDRKLKKRPTVALPRLRSYEDKGGSGLTSLSASQLSKVQSWLEANNLNALKLTIFDVLTAPNDSEQDDDEELQAILSQLAETSLYNEIVEVARATGFDKNKLKHITLDKKALIEYEYQVEDQQKVYQKYLLERLNSLLPEREKETIRLNSIYRIDRTNRAKIAKSLEYSNWPLSRRDFDAIYNQIHLCHTFAKLSASLRQFLDDRNKSQESNNNNNNSQQNETLPTDRQATTSDGETDLNSSNKQGGASQREHREILLTNLPYSKASSHLEKLMKSVASKEDKLSRGDKVIARDDMFGYYYTGKVAKIVDARHVNIHFDKDGSLQTDVSIRHVVKLASVSYLSPGDYVMACVINEFEQKCWVPGIVQTIHQHAYPKLFTVLYFNGQEGENTRQELAKITRNAYGFIVNYIRSKMGINTSLKTNDQEGQEKLPPQPIARPPTPPGIDELKKDIVDSIKNHFDALKLDDKYQTMYDELHTLRKKQRTMRKDLEGKFKVLRTDFEEWKNQEPPVILPDPNKLIYQSNEKIRRHKKRHHKDKGADDDNTDNVDPHAGSRTSKQQRRTQNASDDDELEIKPNVILTAKSAREEPEPASLSADQRLQKLASELSELEEGEEVLAKWPDDGWYYRSIVKRRVAAYQYEIEDSLRDVEVIDRVDIISEINDSRDIFEVGDPVVALHPHYEFSYAPGQLVDISPDSNKLLVRFYDFVEHVVLRQEVYKLARIKFQMDINSIIELEKRWIGQTVVARNNFSNVYEMGKVMNRVGNGRQYTVEWSNGKQSIQNANHIFGTYTRNPAIQANDYVLAPRETIFLPGRVLGKRGNQLRVKFVDGVVDEDIGGEDCYWLSRDYYQDCCAFYRRDSDMNAIASANSLLIERKRGPANGAANEAELTNGADASNGRSTPIINANAFYSGKSNKTTNSTRNNNNNNNSSNLSDDDY